MFQLLLHGQCILVYGDKNFLENQYQSMKAWVEYIRKKAGDSYIWKGGSKYGDWLFYHPPVNNHTEADGYTDHDFIATAFFAYSSSLLADAAKALGKTDDEKTYTDLFNKIKNVFINEYVTNAGRVGTNSQTSYVLALKFNLLPDNLRSKAAEFLNNDIKNRDNHLSTGFLGTPYLCHVLSSNGYTEKHMIFCFRNHILHGYILLKWGLQQYGSAGMAKRPTALLRMQE